ncbi:ornithine cyclodeaminase [Diplocarpon rosae]|nr:ornithine cyclodeaminase [Diplocarpon rosae]
MPLTVLSDENVKEIFHNLTRDDVAALQKAMRDALHEYATGTMTGACAYNQPNRTVVESAQNSTTTLFMPSISTSSIAIKVVTLASPSSDPGRTITASVKEDATPYGSLTLMGTEGKPFGFLNAEEITAFRTALASSLLMLRRTKVKNITVFGTGKQAYWHVRLALLLRGSTIKNVHFINRDFNERAANVMKAFVTYDLAAKRSEGWAETQFDLASLKYSEIDRILKERLRASDIIICTTPATKPLFDHTILTNSEGRMRARLIIAIGSYKSHMIEIPPEVVTQAIKTHGEGHHFHKHAQEGGVIVVDNLECLKEAGELVQAGVQSDRTVELGELVTLNQMHPDDDDSPIEDSPQSSPNDLSTFGDSSSETPGSLTSRSPPRKSSFTLNRKPSFSLRSRSRGGSMSSQNGNSWGRRDQTAKEDQMSRWLSGGNVIYKSVGMGLMDLVVGGEVVKLARKKNIGTTIRDF